MVDHTPRPIRRGRSGGLNVEERARPRLPLEVEDEVAPRAHGRDDDGPREQGGEEPADEARLLVPRRLDDRAEVGEAGASLAGRAPLSRASSRRAYQRTSAATASTAAGLQSSATAGALPPRARATRGLPREGCRPR